MKEILAGSTFEKFAATDLIEEDGSWIYRQVDANTNYYIDDLTKLNEWVSQVLQEMEDQYRAQTSGQWPDQRLADKMT